MEAALQPFFLLFEDDQTFWKLKAIQYQSFRQHQKWRRLTRVLLRQSLKDFECLTYQYLKIQSDGKILERTPKNIGSSLRVKPSWILCRHRVLGYSVNPGFISYISAIISCISAA